MNIIAVTNVKQLKDLHNNAIRHTILNTSYNSPLINETSVFCFTTYFGCGHHLFVYLTEHISTKQCTQLITQYFETPEIMATEFQKLNPDACVVVHDTEMGGIISW